MTKEPTQYTMMVAMVLSICSVRARWSRHGSSERLVPRIPMGVLLPVIHLLFEGLCFLLINKTKPSKALLEFESVKECTILIVGEGVVYFLVPDDAAVGRL